GCEHESVVEPELARDVPRLLGRRFDVQPTLVALLDDFRVGNLVGRDLIAGPRLGRRTGGQSRSGRYVIAVVVRRRFQVRRNLQRRRRGHRFVVDLLANRRGGLAAGKRERAQGDGERATRGGQRAEAEKLHASTFEEASTPASRNALRTVS